MGIENRTLSLIHTLKDSIDCKWGHWIDHSLESRPDATLLAGVCKGFGFKFQPIKQIHDIPQAQIERRAMKLLPSYCRWDLQPFQQISLVSFLPSLSARFLYFPLLYIRKCLLHFCFVIISGAWLTLYLISVFYLKSLRKPFFSLGCYIICASAFHV